MADRERILRKLSEVVINCEVEEAAKVAQEALSDDLDPLDAIENGLVKGIREVGRLFSKKEVFLPELIVAGDAMKAAVAVLEPTIPKGKERILLGKFLIGTVEEDIHDIGKNLVGSVV